MGEKIRLGCINFYLGAKQKIHDCFADTTAQGTTEYAILVGVLVVIAMAAILLLRPQITDLWSDIEEGVAALT